MKFSLRCYQNPDGAWTDLNVIYDEEILTLLTPRKWTYAAGRVKDTIHK